MPPKQASARLAGVKPTAEEIAAAKKILTSGPDAKKTAKSKMASMAHWLKDNPDQDVASARGEARKEYLMAFLVHQMRDKSTAKTLSNEHAFETDLQKRHNDKWMSQEQMDTTYGAMKAAGWRTCGLMKTRPDPITGSTEPHMLEYACPEDMESFLSSDKTKLTLGTVGEGEEQDLAMFSASGSDEVIAVKKEEETPEVKLQKRVSELKADPKPTLRRFQDYELDSKTLHEKASGHKYCDGFISDNTKFLTKVTKAIKILNTLCLKGATNDAELGKLICTLDAIDVEQGEIAAWAERFGFKQVDKRNSRKRKGV